MTKKGEEYALKKCLERIEERLHWGDSAQWTTYDFEKLSEEIHKATGVRLSVTTLKRVWEKLKYESAPTHTTLNTLAKFAGYADWRAFNHQSADDSEETNDQLPEVSLTEKPVRRRFSYYWLLSLLPVLAVAYVLTPADNTKRPEGNADSSFAFTANKMISEGVPNSVVFHYNASAAKADSVYIVQTWDIKRKIKVPKNGRSHSGIYYYPGYLRAKLIADDRVVRTHDLWITSDGWLSLAEGSPAPVYFKKEESIKKGIVEINDALLKKYNLSLHPKPPGIRIFNQRDLGDLKTDHFTFETSVKNDFKAGANACQPMQVLIQCKNDVIIIPLATKACVGNLSLSFCGTVANSANADLSGFGADLSRWTKLKVTVTGKKAIIYVNDLKAYALDFKHDVADIVGVQYRFNGTGAVGATKFTGTEKVFEL